jgi:hypothetical protein
VGVVSMCVATGQVGVEDRGTLTSCVGAVRHRHNAPAIASNRTRDLLSSTKHKAISNVLIVGFARRRRRVFKTDMLSVVFVAV